MSLRQRKEVQALLHRQAAELATPKRAAPANAGYPKGGVLLAVSTTAMRPTFDPGTLLLAQEGDDVDVVDVPWVLWHARVGLYRAPPFRHARLLDEASAASGDGTTHAQISTWSAGSNSSLLRTSFGYPKGLATTRVSPMT